MIRIKQGTRAGEFRNSLTIGSGPEADFFVPDPIMAGVHFEIRALGGGRFEVVDRATVSGTYVAGEPVQERLLVDGDEIIAGVTGTRVKIAGEGAAATLQLTVRLNAFAYQKAKEGAFDNDPDRWVRSEQRLGRFPALRLGNRLAMLGAAVGLVSVGLVSTWFETVSDPGPLTPAHATMFAVTTAPDLAGLAAARARVAEQGCDVCHADGGTPQTSCMVCHEPLSAPATRRHPFHGADGLDVLPTMAGGLADGATSETFCVVCHTEHEPKADGEVLLKTGTKALVGDCVACHGAGASELPVPVLPTVDTPPTAFSSVRFPHASHVKAGMDCAICHEVDARATELARAGLDDPARADFAEVPFETCAQCHVEPTTAVAAIAARSADWIEPAPKWAVRWHGSEGGAETCGQCHSGNGPGGFGPDFVTVERARGTVAMGTRAFYDVERRSHDREFATHAGGQACIDCHRDRNGGGQGAVASVAEVRAPFWHGLHLPRSAILDPARASVEQKLEASSACLTCHGDLGSSTALAAAPAWWRADGERDQACATCHLEADGDSTRATALTPSTTGLQVVGSEVVTQFPHKFHTELEGGCFACHGFETAAGQSDRFAVVVTTDAQAASCTNCHTGHLEIAGGSCQQCHPFAAGTRDVYWHAASLTEDPRPQRPTLADPQRDWPAANSFSHLSRGHVGKDCGACHQGMADVAVDRLGDIVAPDESMALCRDCHLKEQFHWR